MFLLVCASMMALLSLSPAIARGDARHTSCAARETVGREAREAPRAASAPATRTRSGGLRVLYVSLRRDGLRGGEDEESEKGRDSAIEAAGADEEGEAQVEAGSNVVFGMEKGVLDSPGGGWLMQSHAVQLLRRACLYLVDVVVLEGQRLRFVGHVLSAIGLVSKDSVPARLKRRRGLWWRQQTSSSSPALPGADGPSTAAAAARNGSESTAAAGSQDADGGGVRAGVVEREDLEEEEDSGTVTSDRERKRERLHQKEIRHTQTQAPTRPHTVSLTRKHIRSGCGLICTVVVGGTGGEA